MAKLPKTLKAFVEHGVYISENDETQAKGRCPFCGKQRHFCIDVVKQLWSCKAGGCMKDGNFLQFLKRRMAQYQENFDGQPAKRLAMNRKIARATLTRWGVGYDPKTEQYMIPMYSHGRLVDVHRYSLDTKDSLATSTAKGGAIMIVGDPDLHTKITICEGQWDTYAWDEALRDADRDESVVGAAGASRIPKNIGDLVSGKDVVLAFDNDHAGFMADERSRKLMSHSPRSVKSVHWPDDYVKGYDARDLWNGCGRDGKKFFEALKPLVGAAPVAAVGPRADPNAKEAKTDDATTVPATPAGTDPVQPTGRGLSRKKTIEGYRKWLYMPDTDVLDVAFGTVLANRLSGLPVWLFLVGVPGSLKSEIVQSLGTAALTSRETDITRQSLVSGMQTLAGSDPSLIPLWNGKVVLISDFTTILSMDQKERAAIFGILRTAYDGHYQKKFGNMVHRNYDSTFGILAGVTPVIETFGVSHSVVGERFIKYYISRSGRIQQGKQAIIQSVKNIAKETTMQTELAEIGRQALDRKIDREHPPTLHPEVEKRFYLLAQWAATVRGVVNRDKYTQDLIHLPVVELGTRLVKQFVKLSMGIALFRNKKEVGFDEFRIAAQVARDTAPDRVERVVHHLYMRADEGWFSSQEIAEMSKMPQRTVDKMIADMAMLPILRVRKSKGSICKKYRLSSAMMETMEPLNLYTKEKQWGRAQPVRAKKKLVEKKKVVTKKARRSSRARKGN